MRFEITLRVTTPDGELRESEVIVLDKGHDRHEDTGLSIDKRKALLKALQEKIVEAQAEAFCASKSVCQGCRRRFRKKGRRTIRYRTVFGDIPVTSPRNYRGECHQHSRWQVPTDAMVKAWRASPPSNPGANPRWPAQREVRAAVPGPEHRPKPTRGLPDCPTLFLCFPFLPLLALRLTPNCILQ